MEADNSDPEHNSGNKQDQSDSSDLELDSSDRDDRRADALRVVRETTESLDYLTSQTRRFAISGLIATAVNVAMFAALLPAFGTFKVSLVYLYVEAMLSAMALTLLGLQELYRKTGDGYFQELSDVIQILFIDSDPYTGAREIPIVQRGRVAVRNFAAAAQMPFVPGPRGPALYAGINLLILIIWVTFFFILNLQQSSA